MKKSESESKNSNNKTKTTTTITANTSKLIRAEFTIPNFLKEDEESIIRSKKYNYLLYYKKENVLKGYIRFKTTTLFSTICTLSPKAKWKVCKEKELTIIKKFHKNTLELSLPLEEINNSNSNSLSKILSRENNVPLLVKNSNIELFWYWGSSSDLTSKVLDSISSSSLSSSSTQSCYIVDGDLYDWDYYIGEDIVFFKEVDHSWSNFTPRYFKSLLEKFSGKRLLTRFSRDSPIYSRWSKIYITSIENPDELLSSFHIFSLNVIKQIKNSITKIEEVVDVDVDSQSLLSQQLLGDQRNHQTIDLSIDPVVNSILFPSRCPPLSRTKSNLLEEGRETINY